MQAMCSATEHMLAEVWSQGGVRDVYADFNELTLNITTNALFGVDMSSSQALGISGEQRWCMVHQSVIGHLEPLHCMCLILTVYHLLKVIRACHNL